jgi:hypothetical protein
MAVTLPKSTRSRWPRARVARLRRMREREWRPVERAAVIAVIAITMGALFVTSYSLALGDPVPHRIDAGLVGRRTDQSRAIRAAQRVARNSLAFHHYDSLHAALHAIDEQRVYAALVLAPEPTLYMASAAGASVARLLDQVPVADPAVRVVDTHPLPPSDPNGLDIFYLMLVATIVGFITIFQAHANAGPLDLRRSLAFVVGLALAAGPAFTLLDRLVLHRLDLPIAESWGILSLHVLAVASFASLMIVLLGRWAILPTWLFFVVLGDSSSGGAVSPPLLPRPFALISQWLPSGATITSLRDAVYFHSYQHAEPIAVLATWAALLFAAFLVISRRRQARTARP